MAICRCCNLDWLEVFCEEDLSWPPRTADWYRARGWMVVVRDYGTPQYREMFTLFAGGFPVFEVRRAPYSVKSAGGIFNANACHIRLSNRTCYRDRAVDLLRRFLLACRLELRGISRIDICLDFCHFDGGDSPQRVINDYMAGRLSKINQSKVSAHGRDQWDGRYWSSLKWGSEASMVTTKIYDKTREMREQHDKPYIRQCWMEAGLISSMEDTSTQVWRVEFSINSDAKKWVQVELERPITSRRTGKKRFVDKWPNSLLEYDSREKMARVFFNLCAHYFHFKYVERTENGSLRRKYDCKDKMLFRPSDKDTYLQLKRQTTRRDESRTDRIIDRRLTQMMNDASRPEWQRVASEVTRIALRDSREDLVESREKRRVRYEWDKVAWLRSVGINCQLSDEKAVQ